MKTREKVEAAVVPPNIYRNPKNPQLAFSGRGTLKYRRRNENKNRRNEVTYSSLPHSSFPNKENEEMACVFCVCLFVYQRTSEHIVIPCKNSG